MKQRFVPTAALALLANTLPVASPVASVATAAPPKGFDEVYQRLHKLGLGIPPWFLSADMNKGAFMPKTPLSDTVSSLLVLNVEKDGTTKSCDVYMTNGASQLAEQWCAKLSQTMHFKPAAKKSTKAFWVHLHSEPQSDEIRADIMLAADKPN